jgi:hypothetical protein
VPFQNNDLIRGFLTRLLQRIGLGYAYGKVADAADDAYALSDADGSARVQKIEEI